MFSLTKTGGAFSKKLSPRSPRRKARASLGLESLEERQLMSMIQFAHGNGHHGKWDRSHIPTVAAQVWKALDVDVLLTGTATGTWTSRASNGTTTYALSGSGVISPLQTVSIAGTMAHSIVQAHDSGTVVLSSPPNSAVQGCSPLPPWQSRAASLIPVASGSNTP
jgi:hypothetical protein